MSDLAASLGQIRNAWLAGRSGLDAAPAPWRDAIGADELALIALAGQATDVLTRQTPAGALKERPLLPPLAAPSIPDALRPRFRRLLATPKSLPSLERPLLAFAAARGFAAHPADWMPAADDDWAPRIYGPWLDWVRAEAVTAPDEVISAENYERWSWTERRKALEDLRGSAPAAALAIIAARAGSEPAERRARLIEILQIKLSEADAEFLTSLTEDRSARVQALARALLARLGRGGAAPELAAELAQTLEVKKIGLINRRKQLVIKPLKNNAQVQRRRELFGLVTLAGLATALGVEELALTETAPDGSMQDIVDFAACVAASGSDSAVRALIVPMLAGAETPAAVMRPLLDRLSPAERRPLMASVIACDTDFFETTLAIAEPMLGGETLAVVKGARQFSALEAHAHAFAHGDEAGRPAAIRALDALLPRIGLLIDAPSAQQLLAQIVGAGLSTADPRLDMLHLNIALKPENAP